jgi:DNA-binding CsgD family transcriptional regulator
VEPSDRGYEQVLAMAMTGLWAWQISERLGCTPEYVAKLKHKAG